MQSMRQARHGFPSGGQKFVAINRPSETPEVEATAGGKYEPAQECANGFASAPLSRWESSKLQGVTAFVAEAGYARPNAGPTSYREQLRESGQQALRCVADSGLAPKVASELEGILDRLLQAPAGSESCSFEHVLQSLLAESGYFPEYPPKDLDLIADVLGHMLRMDLLPPGPLLFSALRCIVASLRWPEGSKMLGFGRRALQRFQSRLGSFPGLLEELTRQVPVQKERAVAAPEPELPAKTDPAPAIEKAKAADGAMAANGLCPPHWNGLLAASPAMWLPAPFVGRVPWVRATHPSAFPCSPYTYQRMAPSADRVGDERGAMGPSGTVAAAVGVSQPPGSWGTALMPTSKRGRLGCDGNLQGALNNLPHSAAKATDAMHRKGRTGRAAQADRRRSGGPSLKPGTKPGIVAQAVQDMRDLRDAIASEMKLKPKSPPLLRNFIQIDDSSCVLVLDESDVQETDDAVSTEQPWTSDDEEFLMLSEVTR